MTTSTTLLVRALLAYSVHEHQEGHARRIDVTLDPGSITVQDDGRGMALHREGYVAGLMATLVRPLGPVQLHGIGLSLVAASTPRLDVESRRGGSVWTQSFTWGIADGEPTRRPCGPETGTRVTIVGEHASSSVDADELLVQVDLWRERHPTLTVHVSDRRRAA